MAARPVPEYRTSLSQFEPSLRETYTDIENRRPETVSQNSSVAAENRENYASETSRRLANSREYRTYLCDPEGPQRWHWLADDAVSCEPVSAANSLLTGKITGNFAKNRPFTPITASDHHADPIAYRRIPYATGTGNFQTRIRELFPNNREFPPAVLWYSCRPWATVKQDHCLRRGGRLRLLGRISDGVWPSASRHA
jgi:hypothetical protein